MKKRKGIIITIIIVILLVIIALWISGVIPKQIARISATHYLKKNFPKMQFEYEGIEWSPSFGGYSIRFKDENNETHGFIMNNKYFPTELGQGKFALEEEYREKYAVKPITLRVSSLTAEDLLKEYTLSDEDSNFLFNLVKTIQCRDYTCDGIADYHFTIDNENYGIEVYAEEIHILPYSDSKENEAVITGENYKKLKEILEKYPQDYEI